VKPSIGIFVYRNLLGVVPKLPSNHGDRIHYHKQGFLCQLEIALNYKEKYISAYGYTDEF
jgi:hypothetical protein